MKVQNYRGFITLKLLLTFTLLIIAVNKIWAQQPTPSGDISAVRSRKATLPELYAMFFRYAVHVESRANADERLGEERSFYRQHLQKASGLDPEEYRHVLESAERFVSVDTELESQMAIPIIADGTAQATSNSEVAAYVSPEELNHLLAQRQFVLETEIANLRESLGNERTGLLDKYLLEEYSMQGNSHMPVPEGIDAAVNQTRKPSSAFSFTPLAASAQTNTAVSALLSGAVSQATSPVIGQQQCIDNFTDDQSGKYTICADSQLSYVGSNQVEPYAHMSWNLNNIYLSYIWVQGLFYVNQIFHDNLGCNQYSNIANYCIHTPNVSLDSGNNALYQWQAKATIGYFNADCTVAAYCYTYTNSVTSNAANVRMLYPVVTSIAPLRLNPGTSGILTISGNGLISPFQNPPTVTVSNRSVVFQNFTVQSYNYLSQTINIAYSVLSNAPSVPLTITIDNGFGIGMSGNLSFAVNPLPPSIAFRGTDITGTDGSSPVTVFAGQEIYLKADLHGADPQTQDWTINGIAVGGYEVAGDFSTSKVIPLTQTEQDNILLYWLPDGTSGSSTMTATFEYCLDSAQTRCSKSSARFNVIYPTNPGLALTPGVAELFTEDGDPTLGFGDIEDNGSRGMKFTASFNPPLGGDNAAMFVQLIEYDNFKYRIYPDPSNPLKMTKECKGPIPAFALDRKYPYPNFIDDLTTYDSPSVALIDTDTGTDLAEAKRRFSAKMYLLWMPSTQCNDPFGTYACDIPVPLGYSVWQFNGDTINTKQIQNKSNSGSIILNDTKFILNSCSKCASEQNFTVTEGVSPNADSSLGFPVWGARSSICDPQ